MDTNNKGVLMITEEAWERGEKIDEEMFQKMIEKLTK